MEKASNFTSSPSTPLTKQNIQIRIVSNSDKENISNDIFLSPSDQSAFSRSDSQETSCFIEVPPIPEEILNPFLIEFKKASNISDIFSMDLQKKSETDSLMTTDSLGSQMSLLSINNQKKGFKIPKDKEDRVLADLTYKFFPQRKLSDFGPNTIQEIRMERNLNMQNVDQIQRRRTIPIKNLNKENKGKNLIKPLLKYKNGKKKRTRFGIRKANSRKSMRI